MSAFYLHRIFFPKAIAVFGQGDREALLADKVIRNIRSAGYRGRVFGICSDHSDLESIEGAVDLGILSAPAAGLAKAIQSFAKVKPAGVIVVSHANVTSDLRREILMCARSADIRLIGPHSWGVLNPMANLNAGFANQPAFAGELAVVSQSSAICATILDLSASRKIGIGFLIGLGDTIDVDFADVIDYLTNHSRVRAILLHVESLGNLRQFMSASRAAARIKPIIVLKTDRHQNVFSTFQPEGVDGVDEISIYDAIFKRAGIIRVETVEGLFDCAELVSKQVRPKGSNLVIISDSKIPGDMAVDALRDRGVHPISLNDAVIQKIDQIIAGGWSRNNPICTRSELAPEVVEQIISCCLTVPEIDGILIILSPQFIDDPEAFAGYLSSAVKRIEIPIFVAWMGGERVASARRILNDACISVNETPERAVRAFMVLYNYELNQRLLQEIPSLSADFSVDAFTAREIIGSALARQPGELSLSESLDILKLYGFPVSSARVPGTAEGVFSGTDRLAQKTVEPYTRMTIGAKMIPDFGPVIYLGPDGGIAKIFRSWSIGLPPLNRTLARHMMVSSPILTRFIEAGAHEVESVLRTFEELLIRLSHLVTDFPELAAIDMEVVLTPESKAFIHEARIAVISSSTPSPLHLIISPYPSRYETNVVTKSGLSLFIRPIKPEDAPLLQALWSTFSSKTLYYRFSKYIESLSREMLVSFTQIDYDREIAIAAIHRKKSGDEMLGVGRLYGAVESDIAEFSVVVGDPWQGLGIGAQLLSHLIVIAKDRKIKTIWGIIQRENNNMIELAQNLNFVITGELSDPQVEATLTIIH